MRKRNHPMARKIRPPSTLRVWLEEFAAGLLLVVVVAAMWALMFMLFA